MSNISKILKEELMKVEITPEASMSFLKKKDAVEARVDSNGKLELTSELPDLPPEDERNLGEHQAGFNLASDLNLIRQKEIRKMLAKGYKTVFRQNFKYHMDMKDYHKDESSISSTSPNNYLGTIPDKTLKAIHEAKQTDLFKNIYIIYPTYIRTYRHLVIGEHITPVVDDNVKFDYSIFNRNTLIFEIDRFS